MSKSRSRAILNAAGSLISIGILVYVLREQGWKETQSALGRVTWWYTLLGFLVVCISRLATVGRWHLLLRALDVRVPLKQTFSLTFAGLFAVNFLPTSVGGDVARLAGAVNLGYDSARSAASLVLDRMVGLAGFLFVIPFALPAFVSKAHLPFVALSESGVPHRVRRFALDAFRALGIGMKRPGCMVGALLFTFLHMTCFFTTIWLIITGVGEHMNFWTIAILWSIVYVVTLMPFSINGLGWQEISITYVFTHADDVFVHAGHVSLGAAVAVAALMRAFMVVASLPGAVLMPSIVTARHR